MRDAGVFSFCHVGTSFESRKMLQFFLYEGCGDIVFS